MKSKINDLIFFLIKKLTLLIIVLFLINNYIGKINNPMRLHHVRLFIYDQIQNPQTFYTYAYLKLDKPDSNSFYYNEIIDYGMSLCKLNHLDQSCINQFLNLKKQRDIAVANQLQR